MLIFTSKPESSNLFELVLTYVKLQSCWSYGGQGLRKTCGMEAIAEIFLLGSAAQAGQGSTPQRDPGGITNNDQGRRGRAPLLPPSPHH